MEDKDGKETDDVTTIGQTWQDGGQKALATCYGGKTYATTTAAAAGKLAAESPAPSPGLGGATTTMLSAGFGLLASAVAVMLM